MILIFLRLSRKTAWQLATIIKKTLHNIQQFYRRFFSILYNILINLLLYFSKKKNSPINIELIVSDNQNAKGLEHAKINRINNIIINYNKSENPDLKILKILKKKKNQNNMFSWFHESSIRKFYKIF